MVILIIINLKTGLVSIDELQTSTIESLTINISKY